MDVPLDKMMHFQFPNQPILTGSQKHLLIQINLQFYQQNRGQNGVKPVSNLYQKIDDGGVFYVSPGNLA